MKPITCAAILLSTSLFIGCKKNSGPPSAPETTRVMKGEPMPRRLSPPPQFSMRIAAGAAPLQKMIASGGPIRINDIGDDTELVRYNTDPNTLVTIDQQRGIQIGNDLVMGGPLPPGHRYEIYLDRR